jgi:recombination protein RecA
MTKKSKDLLQELQDKYGDDILIREYPDGHPSVSTGSLAIDVSTGVGGIPVGRYTEIYGPEAGGKTTLCLSICKNALKLGIPVLYVDVEHSVDFPYVKAILGDLYDKKNILIVQPVTAEDAFDMAETGIDNNYGCIIFDSVASIAPEEEMDKDYGKQSIGLSPRLTNQFLKKTKAKIRDNETIFVITNQIRANIGAYVGGYTTPAGYALKHYTSLRIYLSKGQAIEEDDKAVGNYINFVIKKNKLGIPYRQAETNLIYGKGIDYYRDVLKFSTLLGVIKSRGPYFSFEETTLGQGGAKSIEYLMTNPEVLDKIEKVCYNVVGVQYPPVRVERKVVDERNNQDG